MSDDGGRVISLFPGEDGGASLERWAEELGPYLEAREAIEPARHHAMPEPPWPARDNPMLRYLMDRAQEIVDADGLSTAVVWLAAHAWFEGAVEERFRIHRILLGESGIL